LFGIRCDARILKSPSAIHLTAKANRKLRAVSARQCRVNGFNPRVPNPAYHAAGRHEPNIKLAADIHIRRAPTLPKTALNEEVPPVLKGLLTFGLTRRAVILLGLLVFVSAGLPAFSKLNIEAYPNPAPVILEITAQSAGLSAEEMQRYYTIPLEVGLAATPDVEAIRSTSFYGLAFVRIVFQYGVDYYFALTQTQINRQGADTNALHPT
jgi:hypothetical protein